MRLYYLDAYIAIDDLKFKIKHKFDYNNILITCYNACILLLCDEYKAKRDYTTLSDINVKALVEELGTHKFHLAEDLTNYDRLYHTYSLVYSGYVSASLEDVQAALVCLEAIVDWYVNNINYNQLLKLYSYLYKGKALSKAYVTDTLDGRKFLKSTIGYDKLPSL